MKTSKARLARGTRDALPGDMRRRQHVLDVLLDVFLAFGYEPLDTPAIERAETLLDKYGPDAVRLIYRAGLGGKQDLALRYDLTVPLARVMSGGNAPPRPFKRYQIGPVWRGDRPQRGRFREFLQADVDIVGTTSLLADAEIITIVATVLQKLGFADSTTMVNNRKVLTGIGRYAGVPDEALPGLYRAIDKRDKIGIDGVRLELRAVGLPSTLVHRERQAVGRWMRGQADRERLKTDLGSAPVAGGRSEDSSAGAAPSGAATAAQEAASAFAAEIDAFLDALCSYPTDGASDASVVEAENEVLEVGIEALRRRVPQSELIPDEVTDRLLALLAIEGDNQAVIAQMQQVLTGVVQAEEGLAELSELLGALEASGVPPTGVRVDLAMARGLEYYTGTIFETLVERPPIGSILGGGRYDRLIGQFGNDMPAVGTSFGVDRLIVALEEADLFPDDIDQPTSQLLVTRFDDATTPDALRLVGQLRREGIRTELYFDTDRLGDQIRYALRRSIPFVAIVGPDEAAQGAVTLRDLRQRKETTIPASQVARSVREALRRDSLPHDAPGADTAPPGDPL